MKIESLCADASDLLQRAADIKHKINEGLTLLSSEPLTEEENTALLTSLVASLMEMDGLLCKMMCSILPDLEQEEPSVAKALRIVMDELRSTDFRREIDQALARPSRKVSGTYSYKSEKRTA
jgi:hypothetical protein